MYITIKFFQIKHYRSKLKNQNAASLYKDDGQTRISTLYLAHLLNRGDHPQQERLLQELLRNLMNLRIEDEVSLYFISVEERVVRRSGGRGGVSNFISIERGESPRVVKALAKVS